jgi:hypothetical protein
MDSVKSPDSTPTLHQTKPDPKGKAVTAFIFGLISLAVPFILLGLALLLDVEYEHPYGGFLVLMGIGALSFLIVLPLSIFGLIFGMLGLKSTKRTFAIVGITLSILALARFFLFFL